MVKVVWTDAALLDLDDIGNYIPKDSLRYAQLTENRIFNAVDILEKKPIHFNYRIVYFVVDKYKQFIGVKGQMETRSTLII